MAFSPTPASTIIRGMTSQRSLILASIFALAGTFAFWVDMPIAEYCQQLKVAEEWPGELVRFLKMSEVFGHGLGVVIILVTVFFLDPKGRHAIPLLAAAAFGAGLAANCFKLMVARIRPRAFDFSSVNSVWDTFAGLAPFGEGGSRLQSFPSAHTATAVGLAIALAWLYPRGRWLFAFFAFLVACYRIQTSAHFPSDVLFGAALGLLVGNFCINNLRWFDRFEGKLPGGDAISRTTRPDTSRS